MYSQIEGKLFYSLKQTDHNGAATYSQVVSLQYSVNGNEIMEFNSVHNILSVYLPASDALAWILVNDVFGRIIYSGKVIPETINTVDFSMNNRGVYVASLWYDNKNIPKSFGTKKFLVKQ